MREVETLIIGGGISGLATAWELDYRGDEVEVWEAESRTGGKIATHESEGYTTEQSASMVLNFRPEVSSFLEESGLDNYKLLRTPTTKRYLINQGTLQEIPMQIKSILFSPLWTLPGKLRLMIEPFIRKGGDEHESVADFIRRRLGNEMLDKAMSAYISGTLASDPEQADSFSVLPHLTALEQRYGSLSAGIFARKVQNKKRASVTEGFSFQGGMETLVSELTQLLRGKVHTGHKIIDIAPHKYGWIVHAETDNGERSCFTRNLVLGTPAATAASLVKSVDWKLYKLLADIKYTSLSVVHLGFSRNRVKHNLEGTGFLTPYKEKLKLNGSMWMHSLFSQRAPEGKVLLSNYLGGARNPDAINLSHQQCIDTTIMELQPLVGCNGEPEWARVDQHAKALPLYYGNYMLRQQEISRQLQFLPGLHLQGNYLGGVSIRDRIIGARTLADSLSKQLHNSRNKQPHSNPLHRGRGQLQT